MKIRLYLVLVLVLVFCSCRRETTVTTTAPTETSATAETTTVTTTEITATESAAPPPPPTPVTTTEEKKPMDPYKDKVAVLKTTAGDIEIRFFSDVAPNHVKNFIDLSQKGFYNGTKFHRVIPGFMIQGGDPNTKSGDSMWGTGGSGKNVKAEFNKVKHKRGIVSMARSSDPDSASSQFFIMVADYPSLDNQYSAFGQVVKGMDVADKIVNAPKGMNDRPNNPTAIQSVTIRDAKDNEKGPAPQ